ncbi:MAG: hypothetical protein OJF49_002551 [Ktedonobacterales bacterium]|jgi:uncharacterized membrane protein|nr:MAG: hypothetical protein OJF49_002551 [Ktedonobacterales bacterium]
MSNASNVTRPPAILAFPRAKTPPSTTTSRWRWPLALAALLVVGAALRLVGMARQSLWLDEAFSVYLAAHRFPDILSFVVSSDAHPPLYYLLLHLWLIFGVSELAVRSLSALASIAALAVVYLLGRQLAHPRVGLIAAALMATSAFQIWYAQEARMYALTSLAVLLAAYGLVRAWQHGGAGAWTLFASAMLVALYLDYSAFYVFTAFLLWFLRVGRRERQMRRPFLLCCGLIVLGYLPWMPAFWRQAIALGGLTNWISGANGSGFFGSLSDLLFNRSNLGLPGDGPLAILFGACSLLLLLLAFWLPRRTPAYPLLAYWLGWPCLLAFAADLMNRPIVIARTLMVVQPALFLLLALAADITLTAWAARRRQRISFFLLTGCLAVLLIANLAALTTTWRAPVKEDWRAAATFVATHEHPGALILFNAYFTQMPFDYYYSQQPTSAAGVVERGYNTQESLLFADPAQTSLPIRPGPDTSGYEQVWLVLSHTGTSDDAATPPWLFSQYRLAGTWHYTGGVTIRLFQTPTT